MEALSFVKVLVFFIAWIALWLPIAIPLSARINYQFPAIPTVKQKLFLIASLYPLSLIIIWVMMGWEKLSWSDIGWQWQWQELIFLVWGVILALISLTITFILEFAGGLITWQWQNSHRLLSFVLPIFCLSVGISFVEELIFRGFLINELTQDFSLTVSAIASSLIFALLHLVWERKTTIPQLPGLWLMGMVLVEAQIVLGGNIGLAWGLHAGWILGLSCLDSAELISYNTPENSWLTGIHRQPLAGIFGISCLLLVGAGLLSIARFVTIMMV